MSLCRQAAGICLVYRKMTWCETKVLAVLTIHEINSLLVFIVSVCKLDRSTEGASRRKLTLSVLTWGCRKYLTYSSSKLYHLLYVIFLAPYLINNNNKKYNCYLICSSPTWEAAPRPMRCFSCERYWEIPFSKLKSAFSVSRTCEMLLIPANTRLLLISFWVRCRLSLQLKLPKQLTDDLATASITIYTLIISWFLGPYSTILSNLNQNNLFWNKWKRCVHFGKISYSF